MTKEQAENLGRNETLKWILYLFLFFEFVFLILETKSDLANGIIFFVDAHRNGLYLTMLIMVAISTYFVGQKNGRDILINGKHFFLTPFRNGLITIWIVLGFGCLSGLFIETDRPLMSTLDRLLAFILKPYLWITLIVSAPLALSSYYCGNSIRNKSAM